MRKKSIVFLLIPFFLIFSVGLQSSDFSYIQSYMVSDGNNVLTTATTWSCPIVISDDLTGWNVGSSYNPDTAIDVAGNVYVVWEDDTVGEWGAGPPDWEIMCTRQNRTAWSNATVISDDATGWNNDGSQASSIAIDGYGNIHVVWTDYTDGEWGSDREIMYTKHNGTGWSNATVISDDTTGWNNDISSSPDIAIDGYGNMHVVWQDYTDSVGEWGTDTEIMYSNNTGAGWSNATVISDDATGWNDGTSIYPSIAVDSGGNLHVVWEDQTISAGEWGIDQEIMYIKYNGTVWSNATVISDIYGWNYGDSGNPAIAIDDVGNLHVVWADNTPGEWGSDYEIMYVNYNGALWSNATVISDDATDWNDGGSAYPSIAIGDENVHVVWHDDTNGEWGTDREIMYTKHNGAGWSNVIVISDIYRWNDDESEKPSIAIDGAGNVHIVWQDWTDGNWGTDIEIMYLNKTASIGEQITFIIIPLQDSTISLLSPLGLGIIGIAVATAVIITLTITKKSK